MMPTFVKPIVVALLLFAAAPLTARSQQPALSPEDPAPAADKVDGAQALADRQEQIASEFERFEEVMLRLAELTAGSDPDRAALLKKAVSQSKDRLIGVQFERLVELLKTDQLSLALTSEEQVNQDLHKLLELLLSADASEQNRSEQARIRAYLEQVNKLIKKETAIRGQTEGRGDAKRLADSQRDVAEETGKLARQIEENEGGGEPQDGQPGDDQKPGEGQESENPSGEKPEGKQGDKDGKPGEGQQPGGKSDGKPGEPSEGQPGGKQGDQPGQPGGEQGDQQAQQEQQSGNPAQKRLQAAQQRMREAQEKLEKAQRDEAVDRQEEAIRELEQAKADLEEILRQLREEELARTLQYLEARFRRMLELQLEVYEGTLRLDQVPELNRGRNDEIESGRLSRKESQIVVEVDKAITILREEGSAVAFPEAVEQMREDMLRVVVLLGQFQVGDETQLVEEDVIAALEEMIEALQQAQQEMQDQQQQPPPPPGETPEPPLIDTLAELKMIRSLQLRVNSRTEFYKKRFLEGEREQVDSADVLSELQKLAERQQRIFDATRDIATGRNR